MKVTSQVRGPGVVQGRWRTRPVVTTTPVKRRHTPRLKWSLCEPALRSVAHDRLSTASGDPAQYKARAPDPVTGSLQASSDNTRQ